MTRSGVTYLLLKTMETLKRRSVRTVHSHQALKQVKPIVP